ncbi:MAG: peptidoglycan-binding protein LysM [Chitinophagales bacterium]|nr:peptidoglycan-binding protein LysM [Chitinophagales bacterium]
MGLFSFIKNAGKKIFNKEEAVEVPTLNPEKGNQLKRVVEELDFKVEDLDVQVVGDTATVNGTVESQSVKEKIVLVVGNTEGIAQVDDRMNVEKPEPEAKFHTVVSGDTLGKIAKEYYGNAMKYPVIFEANKPMLKDPDKIYPGQVLRIPELEGQTA